MREKCARKTIQNNAQQLLLTVTVTIAAAAAVAVITAEHYSVS